MRRVEARIRLQTAPCVYAFDVLSRLACHRRACLAEVPTVTAKVPDDAPNGTTRRTRMRPTRAVANRAALR
eukprot:6045757-Pyramimonas_sp.AAC.1